MATVSATSATFGSWFKLSMKNSECLPSLSSPVSKFSALGASLDTVGLISLPNFFSKSQSIESGSLMFQFNTLLGAGGDRNGFGGEFEIGVEEESSRNITTIQEAADLIEKLVQKKAEA